MIINNMYYGGSIKFDVIGSMTLDIDFHKNFLIFSHNFLSKAYFVWLCICGP